MAYFVKGGTWRWPVSSMASSTWLGSMPASYSRSTSSRRARRKILQQLAEEQLFKVTAKTSSYFPPKTTKLKLDVWGNVSSEVSSCCFKLDIFITAIVSWHIKLMGLLLVGGRMNAIFSVHFCLNCRFSLSTFLLAVNLEHAIFVQSRLLQLAKCQYANCSKNESES